MEEFLDPLEVSQNRLAVGNTLDLIEPLKPYGMSSIGGIQDGRAR